MNNGKFIFHLRVINSDGSISCKGGATVLFDETMKSVTIAVCSKKDNFCKKRGIKICQTRMDTYRESLKSDSSRGKKFILPYDGSFKISDLRNEAVKIANHNNVKGVETLLRKGQQLTFVSNLDKECLRRQAVSNSSAKKSYKNVTSMNSSKCV